MLTAEDVELSGADGGMLRIWARPGQGPGTLVFLHATGFNASAYRPFLEAIEADCAVLAPSLRGHGATRLGPTSGQLRSWQRYADDVLAVLQQLSLDGPLYLAGHSMGAVTALLVADRLRHQVVSGIIAIDPVIVPALVRGMSWLPFSQMMRSRLPIIRRTEARRNGWPDRQAAHAYCTKSRFFGDWHPDALEGYLDEGLVRDGGELRLACDPSWEAATFAAQGHRFWGPLTRLRRRGIPVTALRPLVRSTTPEKALPRLEGIGVKVLPLAGHHLAPQTHPLDVAKVFSRALGGFPGNAGV